MVAGIGNSQRKIQELIASAATSLTTTLGVCPERWLLVDVAGQQLVLVKDEGSVGVWPVSTASSGVNAHEGSGGTPPGIHRIDQRIGQGHSLGTIFESRKPTGLVFPRDVATHAAHDDLILTRILTLEGCQDGVNRGPGIDSLARYIYLHGTNREDLLGRPVSHGCIRLSNRDIIEVFDQVQEGDPVVII